MTAPFRDLRSTTLAYQPVAGPAYGQAKGYLNQATQAAGGINIGKLPTLNPNQAYSGLDTALKQAQTPEQAQLRTMAMGQLQGLNTAPDRASLAARALQLQREQTAPQWQADLRTVGQKAAAMGRLGAGMTTTELDDVTLAREKALGQFGEQAAIDAAGQEMQDRLNRLNATTGYEGQITSEDLARAGFTQGNALAKFGVQSGVADTALAQAQARANAAAARAGIYSGAAGTSAGMATNTASFGADQAARAVALAQQQQGFQADEAQQAVQNRAQQQLLQEQLLQGQFNRQLAGAGAAGGYGFANDPYQLMLAGAGGINPNSNYLQQAAQAAAAAAGGY